MKTILSAPRIGSYRFRLAGIRLPAPGQFGDTDRMELIDDALSIRPPDQMNRLDCHGPVERGSTSTCRLRLHRRPRTDQLPPRFGPPRMISGESTRLLELRARAAWHGRNFERLRRWPSIAVTGDRHPPSKAKRPGPYTLSGRWCERALPDRNALTEACCRWSRAELRRWSKPACREIHGGRTLHELLRRTAKSQALGGRLQPHVEPGSGRCHLSTHLCFGNLQGPRGRSRAVTRPWFPAFLDMKVDEIHLEMAHREVRQ